LGRSPELVVIAREIGQDFIFAAALEPNPPAYMYVPLSSLPVSLTKPEEVSPRPVVLYTNATGMLQFPLVEGVYDVVIKVPAFQIETEFNASVAKQTIVNLTVFPVFSSVESLVIINQDGFTAIGPATKLVAHLNSTNEYRKGGLVEVLGTPRNGSSSVDAMRQTVRVNSSVVGEYRGTEGFWLVLRPLGTDSLVPVDSIRVLSFEPRYTVETIAWRA